MRHSQDNQRGLYRSRNKMICGVCAGLAEYFDFSTFWIRAGALLLLLLTGLWPTMIAYFIAALIMKPAPVYPINNEDEREFYDSYVRSPRYTINSIKRQFDQLDRRIQRMEDVVTNRGYEWDRRFRES